MSSAVLEAIRSIGAVDWEFVGRTIPRVAAGIPVTFQLVIVTLVISVPFALLNALTLHKGKNKVARAILGAYFSFVRSMPAIIIIFLVYTSIPLMLATLFKSLDIGINVYSVDNMIYGYVVFSFITIPWLSEVFRSGLTAVDASQYDAAKAIGMTSAQALVHVILPQALTASLPVLTTTVTNLIKMTSLAFAMTIYEITGLARIASADSIRYVECYLVIFVIYLIVCLLVEQAFKYAERRITRRLNGS